LAKTTNAAMKTNILVKRAAAALMNWEGMRKTNVNNLD